MSTTKVVLTGTTGNLGSSIFKRLLTLIPKTSIIVSLHNPSNRPENADGIEIREGNYEDPSSLDKAFAGADILFMISCPGFGYQDRIDAHRNAIEAAKRSSIRQIIYTSMSSAGAPSNSESVSAVMQVHLFTEKYLKSQLPSTMTYTIIREGIYTEVFPQLFGLYDISSKPSQVVLPTGDNDKLISFTKRDDLAEATAKIIQSIVEAQATNGGRGNEFVNKTVILAATPKHSLRTFGELIGRILGTAPVTIKYVSPEEYASPDEPVARFLGSPEMAYGVTTVYAAIGNGDASYTGEGSRELERLLGREPEDVEVTLRRIFGKL